MPVRKSLRRSAQRARGTVRGGCVYANTVAGIAGAIRRDLADEAVAVASRGPVRTLADMTAEEWAAIEKQYGAKIHPPSIPHRE